MRLVVDANILVSELLRERGRALVANKRLELFIAQKTMEEARYELRRRASLITQKSEAPRETVNKFLAAALKTVDESLGVFEIEEYQFFEKESLSRIPRDPDDWHTVALNLNADI